MSWENIIKRNCGCGKDVCEKYGAAPTMEKLSPKQKRLDRNHNGAIDAQDFHIMRGSEEKMEKSPTRKHYTKEGKEWKGKTHKMPDGNLMTEDPHNEKSVRLYHYDELPTSKRRGAFTR